MNWVAGRKDVHWYLELGIWALYIGKREFSIVYPDRKYPKMFRIKEGDWVSDMANLSRAKDAAVYRLLKYLNDDQETHLI